MGYDKVLSFSKCFNKMNYMCGLTKKCLYVFNLHSKLNSVKRKLFIVIFS